MAITYEEVMAMKLDTLTERTKQLTRTAHLQQGSTRDDVEADIELLWAEIVKRLESGEALKAQQGEMHATLPPAALPQPDNYGHTCECSDHGPADWLVGS